MIRRRLVLAALLLAALTLAPRSVSAQNPALRPDTIAGVADTIPQEFPVPRAAFIRAMLVPGLGHFYVRSPTRGLIYAGIQGSSWYMLVKTIGKLNDARDVRDQLTGLAEDSVRAVVTQDTTVFRQLRCELVNGATECDPLLFENAVSTFPGLEGARSLVTSRERHRQDWIVYTLFFTFVAAADAYVTAHLKDFPVDITTSRAPDGGVSIGLSLNLGSRSP